MIVSFCWQDGSSLITRRSLIHVWIFISPYTRMSKIIGLSKNKCITFLWGFQLIIYMLQMEFSLLAVSRNAFSFFIIFGIPLQQGHLSNYM